MDTLEASEAASARVAVAPRVTQVDLESKIAHENTFNAGEALEAAGQPAPAEAHLLTIHVVTTRSGFTVLGKSACAHPANFDAALGRKFAREDALRQLWALEGYLLREKLAGGPDVTAIARVAHEVNRAWCEHNGDGSQPPWDLAPPWQVRSAIDGVRFHLENPTTAPSASHDNWMALKDAEGWVYGETKDPTLKRHPCLVPFEELPANQQVKDKLFRAVVHGAAGIR